MDQNEKMTSQIKRVPDFLKKNIKELVVSLVIAIGIWVVVSVQVFPTIESVVKGIAIEVQPTEYMLSNDLQIINDDYDTLVDISIEGKRYDISGLTEKDFYASLDLSSVKGAGTFTVPVNISAKTSADYTLLNSNPMAVTLRVDEIVTRDFPVVATAPDISLPEGYYVDTMVASAETVKLTGSAAILDRVEYVEARSVLSGEITETHETQSQLIVYSTNGGKIIDDEMTIAPDKLTVTIPVYKQKELPLKFTLTNYSTYFDVNSLGYEIQPKSIIVAAPDDSIDYISELDIGTIDIADIKINQTVTIPIMLPEGYKNLSGNNNARIVWDIADYGKLDFAVSNINITNVPDNYNVSAITNELAISVIGPSDVISRFTDNDFYITVNLLGVSLREGAQDVDVDIRIKGNSRECWIAGNYKITINAELKAEEE